MMASVQDLLAASRVKRKSPFLGLLEGVARGFGQAQAAAPEQTRLMMLMDQQRVEQEQRRAVAEQRAAKEAESRALQQKMAAEVEALTKSNFKQAGGEPPAVTPAQKLEVEYRQDENGNFSKVLKPAKAQTKDLDGILAERVQSGELSLESAYKLKTSGASSAIKPPSGFRFTAAGELEAIPGGPADAKRDKETEKVAATRQAAQMQADRIIAKVDQALSKVGATTAGFGANLRSIPGTTAKDLDTDLQTIKANLGFAELQAMRQASPTGGALGQVAVQELEALQATVASLDQKQSPAQLRQRLGDIRKHYEGWKGAVEQSVEAGGAPVPPAAPAVRPPAAVAAPKYAATATHPTSGERQGLNPTTGQWEKIQ